MHYEFYSKNKVIKGKETAPDIPPEYVQVEREEGEEGTTYIDPRFMDTGSKPSFYAPTEDMIVDEELKTHMDNTKSLLEKEPKLEDDI